MVFSSLEFLFLFLPLTCAVYLLAPRRWRTPVLLAVSLIFYAWSEPRFLPLMLLTVSVDYAFGLALSRSRRRKKLWLIGAVTFNLALLAYFKYSDLLLSLLGLPPTDLGLPIGISFYTFQALSYVVDVYRGDAEAQTSPITFATYVTLFPQLVAGPIIRYTELDGQLTDRRHSITSIGAGISCFVVGLCKKVLLGNTAGAVWESIRDLPPDARSASLAWLGLICFAFQIYFDFSGYSDMAIGLGRLFGFRFPQNFNYPYTAVSVTDFWRRWHITLSEWFREYLYIPLGGNRRGKRRTYLNLLIVWAATGLWHGASLNFLLWGLYYFLFLVAEKAFLGKILKKLPIALSWGYTTLTVLFGWLIFVFDGSTETLSIASGVSYLGSMLGTSGLYRPTDLYELSRNALLIAIMCIASTPYPKRLFYRLYESTRGAAWISALLCSVGLLLGTAYLVGSAYNPFLYFRF